MLRQGVFEVQGQKELNSASEKAVALWVKRALATRYDKVLAEPVPEALWGLLTHIED